MLEKYYVFPTTVDRVKASWIAPAIERYVEWLSERCYRRTTVLRRVPILVSFGEFAKANGARRPMHLPKHVELFVQMVALLNIYSQYDVASGQPSALLTGADLGSDFLAAVYSAYSQVQQGGRLAALRERLKAEIPECPYCGFGEIRELDHHLPRVSYRGLAIYARNLIPCCSMCNNKKRSVAGDAPNSQFAHVYFEQIPPARFLMADIDVSPNGLVPSFSIQKCAGMTDDVFDRLTFQFSRLELNRRYQAQVTMFLQSHRMSIEDAASGGGNSLLQWLERASNTMQTEFGLNNWRTALFYGLANSPSFCGGEFRFGYQPRAEAAPLEIASSE